MPSPPEHTPIRIEAVFTAVTTQELLAVAPFALAGAAVTGLVMAFVGADSIPATTTQALYLLVGIVGTVSASAIFSRALTRAASGIKTSLMRFYVLLVALMLAVYVLLYCGAPA